MGGRILSIAANTFRETVRNKILYGILAFALVVIGLTWFLASLSVGEMTRIIADVGLACIHVFGVVMAVFLGISLVSREVERKTVYLILSKPVPRWEFVAGKAAGLSGTLALMTLAMAAALFAIHAAYGGSAEPGIFVASAGIFMELVLIVCLASFFSTFTTPILSAIFTLSLVLIGHISKDLVVFGERSSSAALRWGGRFLFYALPNLEVFNWKNAVVYGEARSPALIAGVGGYFVFYCAAVLLAACLIFSRKDLK
ncbi:MAG: ABC transporter permease [Deltaproteobacteria bacterium]|nr:ABC transporter permease [Deltaproteobacteria bacterium]